jgi:hypothetical protein
MNSCLTLSESDKAPGPPVRKHSPDHNIEATITAPRRFIPNRDLLLLGERKNHNDPTTP